MPGQFTGSRFGQDSYPRIATSAEMLLEATEVLPFEPMYQPLVPFLPPSIATGGGVGLLSSGSTTSGGTDEWKAYPDRLDLFCYQGDDVQIPLYFKNPGDPDLDMSNENGWSWKGQIRTWHRYSAPLVHDFTIESEGIPRDPLDPTSVGQTLVTLFLPRFHNQYPGVFSWDLSSTGPFEGPTFPKPPDVADEDWPMDDFVKTWLYGYFYVVPRVTTTDFLPPTGALPSTVAVTVTPTGTYGPNGRVP